MPVTESAKKALRNAQAKQARNVQVEAELKRSLKNATQENASQVVSLIDKAAKRNLIHPNKAARLKSRLSKIEAGQERVKTVTRKKSKKATAKATAARATARKSAAKKA